VLCIIQRETVLCDHGILDKTKDTVFSYLASGASSESATTSVNNKSYSGTIQRSDDVTVDSTISKKKTVRFSLNSRDDERNTADSSRTLISFKRKLGERGSLAVKQLPQRPAAASKKLEDGGKITKDKVCSFYFFIRGFHLFPTLLLFEAHNYATEGSFSKGACYDIRSSFYTEPTPS
jgi:hypothetical protein